MMYTVSDFFRTYERSLRIVAGSSGVSRVISSVGILDYELIPGINDRYRQRNFNENMVVLTTFLYARSDPYLIIDAIKHLVSQGVSALVIKNVLHLPIPDQALRYANARDFPVFTVTADGWFFDEVIYAVDKHINSLADRDFVQREIDTLLEDGITGEATRRARSLNPSFCDALQVMFVAFDEPLSPSAADAIEGVYGKSGFRRASRMLAFHDGGILFADTADSALELDVRTLEVPLREAVVLSGVRGRIAGVGISEPLFGLEQLGQAIKQARAACALSRNRGESSVCFADLGIFRAVIPFANQPAMRAFSAHVLNPLQEFDAEHAAQLEKTLLTYLSLGRNVDAAAQELGQHANTVRYRLDKVRALTGLDYRHPDQAEQLSLACVIDAAARLS